MARPSETYGPTDDPAHQVSSAEYSTFIQSILGATINGGGVINDSNSFTPAGLQVSANGTNSLTVAAGTAENAGAYYKTDSSFTVPVVANTGAANRIDGLVVRYAQTNAGKFENTVTYVRGGTVATDSSGGPAPVRQLGAIWDLPLATFTVRPGASTVLAADVNDTRYAKAPQTIVMAPGQIVKPRSQVGQLLIVGPNTVFQGQPDGSWLGIFPVAGTTTGSTSGTTTTGPAVRTRFTYAANWADNGGSGYAFGAQQVFPNGLVLLQGSVQAQAKFSNGGIFTTLPVGARPTSLRSFWVNYTGTGGGVVAVYANGDVQCQRAMEINDALFLDGINFTTTS